MDPEQKNIEQLAKEIAEKGAAGDPVTVLLAKGMSDAVGHLARLADLALGKGKPKDGDGDGKVTGGGDGKDNDPAGGGDGDGDDAPGYEDMNLGAPGNLPRPGANASGSGDPVLDVTKFVFDTGAAIQAQGKQIGQLVALAKAQAAHIKAQDEQIANLGKMLQASTEATTSILGPLAKAVAEQRSAALDIPAGALTPRARAARAAPPDAAPIGGSALIETRTLAKALNTGKISSAAKQAFYRTRRFSENETEHAQIRASLEEIAKTVPR